MIRKAAASIAVCRAGEVPDPGARGFEVDGPYGRVDVIVVRQGAVICGYLNRCPHRATPLETFPDRFLSHDARELICSSHGARFRWTDGLCTQGPCKGMRLQRVALTSVGETIMFDRCGTAS